MASGGYDGSLKFDTKINTDGFEEGKGSLLKAAEKLTVAIENLSVRMDHAFSASGAAAASTARQLDEVTESTRKAREEIERLQKEKASTFTGTITHNDTPSPSSLPDDGKRYDIYGNDVDVAIARNKELEEAARQAAETVQESSRKEEQSVVGLKDSMLYAVEVFKRLPDRIIGLFQRVGTAIDGAGTKARTFQDEIDRYTDALYYAERKGLGLGDAEYDKAYKGLALAKSAAEKYKKSLVGVDDYQKKASKSAHKMGNSMKRVRRETIPLTKSILKLSNMFKLMLIRMAMRTAIKAAQEGFSNLARYSDETNKSMSMLMSANTRLENSFATMFTPALNAAAPALKQMIDLLSTGAAYAGQFLAALSGKSTYVKAVDVEEDYAASLKETNDELKKKEKETKKLAFAFDDLIQVQGANNTNADAYKPPTPDQMFETVEVEADIKDFAEVVKGVLSGLFDPMRQSWDENGSTVIASAKYALGELKNLGKDVGNSFVQVWEKEGYGKAVTDDVMISISNLLYTVRNLADGFEEAWERGDTGLLIMRHLGDLLLEVTGFFRDATEKIKIWSATLDFSPLLKSFDNVLVKTRPIVSKIGDILLWLLEEILLPLTKWGIENGVPAAFDLIAAALETLNAILDALKPMAIWLWEEFLKPFGEWTGKVIIEALKKVTEWLTKFSDWIRDHQEEVENITLAVLAFFAAWKITEFVSGISKMIGSMGSLIGVLSSLDLKFGAIVLVVGSIIYLATQVAKAWDKMTPGEKIATGIIAVAGAIALVVAAVAAFTKDFVTLAIAAGIAALAGLSIAGIASGANSRASSTRAANPYAMASSAVGMYKIPRLATGTVVPPRAGEFAAILGDNNRDTEIVSPVPAMKQAFKEAIEEMGGIGSGNQTFRADLIVDGTKFGQLVYKFNNKERQRVGVRLVTEGQA